MAKTREQQQARRCSPTLNSVAIQCLADLKRIWNQESDAAVIRLALTKLRHSDETLMLEANQYLVQAANAGNGQAREALLDYLTRSLSGTPTGSRRTP